MNLSSELGQLSRSQQLARIQEEKALENPLSWVDSFKSHCHALAVGPLIELQKVVLLASNMHVAIPYIFVNEQHWIFFFFSKADANSGKRPRLV